jgi:hypothetical protein
MVLRRTTTAIISNSDASYLTPRDAVAALLEVFHDDDILCVQTEPNGDFAVTFSTEENKQEFLECSVFKINDVPCIIKCADSRLRYVKIRYLPYEVSGATLRSILERIGSDTTIDFGALWPCLLHPARQASQHRHLYWDPDREHDNKLTHAQLHPGWPDQGERLLPRARTNVPKVRRGWPLSKIMQPCSLLQLWRNRPR